MFVTPLEAYVAVIFGRRSNMSLSGRQFDPKLTELFLSLVARLRCEHDDLDAYLGEAALDSPFLQARDKIKRTLLQTADCTDQSAESRLDL